MDGLYSETEAPWGAEHEPLVETASSFFEGQNVLDVGCGDGRNSLFLAEQGFTITAVDLSEMAVQKLGTSFSEVMSDYRAFVGNIVDCELPECVDNLLCLFVLHYLEPDEAGRSLARLADAIPPRGTACIATFVEGGVFTDQRSSGYLPKPGDVPAFFEGRGFYCVYYELAEQLVLCPPGGKQLVEREIFKRL